MDFCRRAIHCNAAPPNCDTPDRSPAINSPQSVGSTTTQFLYGGSQLLAEYSGTTVLRRYVPGANADEPVIWYEGSGFTDRRWLHTDNQGSIIAYTDGTGTAQATYGYGPYGEPNAWSGSRYRYTGQIEIPEADLYYYKARVYDPTLERFLQTDPAGYQGDINPYAYTGNDPINGSDPSGQLECVGPLCGTNVSDVVSGEVIVQGVRQPTINPILIINTTVNQITIPTFTINLPQTNLKSTTKKTINCPGSKGSSFSAEDPYGNTYILPQPNSQSHFGFTNLLEGGYATFVGFGATYGDYHYTSSGQQIVSGNFFSFQANWGWGTSLGTSIYTRSTSPQAFFGNSYGGTLSAGDVSGQYTANSYGGTFSLDFGVGAMAAAVIPVTTMVTGCPSVN